MCSEDQRALWEFDACFVANLSSCLWNTEREGGEGVREAGRKKGGGREGGEGGREGG